MPRALVAGRAGQGWKLEWAVELDKDLFFCFFFFSFFVWGEYYEGAARRPR